MSSWTVPAEEIVQILQERTGRPLAVFDAILRILQENLAAALDALGIFPEERRQHVYPKAYHLAGEALPSPDNPRDWPRIIVGGSISTEEFGMGWEHQVQVNIVCAWPGPTITRRDFEDSLDIVTVAAGILRHPNFCGTFRDPDNPERILWYALVPGGYSLVPQDWKYYSGWIAHFTARQAPGSHLW